MKLKNFNENFDKIISLVAIFLALVISGILLLINKNILYSFLITFLASLLIFIKNSIITSYVLYRRLEPPSLWMMVNYISSTIIYIGVILVVVLIEPFHLVGLFGLFIIPIVTTIIGIIQK